MIILLSGIVFLLLQYLIKNHDVKNLFNNTYDFLYVLMHNHPREYMHWIKKFVANQSAKYLIEMHHKYYIVNYPYGVKWYKIIIPRKRGPCPFEYIYDENETDVTESVLTFMGPSFDFHKLPITPKQMGYESLTFVLEDDSEKKFMQNDTIFI